MRIALYGHVGTAPRGLWFLARAGGVSVMCCQRKVQPIYLREAPRTKCVSFTI